MKGYAVWNNTTKEWYGNGKSWTKNLPQIFGLRRNAVARKTDILYWQRRYGCPTLPDIRIVEVNVLPVDRKHLV